MFHAITKFSNATEIHCNLHCGLDSSPAMGTISAEIKGNDTSSADPKASIFTLIIFSLQFFIMRCVKIVMTCILYLKNYISAIKSISFVFVALLLAQSSFQLFLNSHKPASFSLFIFLSFFLAVN